MSDDTKLVTGAVVTVLFLVCTGFGGCMGHPHYVVYAQRLAGEAKLREAESSRQIAVEEAKAKEQAARMLAAAEVERAKGVAEANRIIGESLKNNPEYLTYLWISELSGGGHNPTIVYIPTQGGLPILESTRLPAAKP